MSDKKHSSTQSADLEHQNAVLEEKNRALTARIKVLTDENRNYEAMVRALLDNTPFGIVIFDEEHRLVQMNKAAESILGIQHVSAIGQSCARIFDCYELHHQSCPIQAKTDVLDRIETRYSSPGAEEKTLLRSVVQIESGKDFVQVEAFVDISEIKRAQYEIENTNKLKDNFLARVSHELRTPLNAILGFAELLHEKVLEEGNEESEDKVYLDNINRSGHELLRLVDEILEISRITANRMTLDEYEVDISTVLKGVVNKVKSELDENQNDIIVHDSKVKTVWVDQFRLHQVLYHLVHNACKYTIQGSININVDQVDDKIDFSVSDTGVGMDVEQIKNIFHEFEQVDTSYTREFNGVGLGLSLSYQLIQLMGGVLSVTSEPGAGSIFTVSLPYKKDKTVD